MQEEEDRELAEAMEATGLSIYPDDYVDPFPYRSRSRMMSLGNVSAPPQLNQSGRFSSIGKLNCRLNIHNKNVHSFIHEESMIKLNILTHSHFRRLQQFVNTDSATFFLCRILS